MQRDPLTTNLDGSRKTEEEIKVFKASMTKIAKAQKQRARRARLRKLANETGSTYK